MEIIKESFRKTIHELRPGLRKLPLHKELAFVGMIFDALSGILIPHNTEKGKFILTHSHINERYGDSRGFHKENNKLNIFEFSNNWSMQEKIAKSVVLNSDLQTKLMNKMLEVVDDPSYIYHSTGRKILTAPKAICSKHSGNQTSKANVKGIQLESSMIRIDRNSVNQFMHFLVQENEHVLSGHATSIPRIQLETIEIQKAWINRAFWNCWGILFLSSLKGLPNGHLLQQYRESATGRLCGMGPIHLQGILREVKLAALPGLYDHDIVSCHFQFTHQIASKHGYEAGAIREYIENKSAIHELLTHKLNISLDDCKKSMLSFVYGAPLADHYRASLRDTLGEKATEFKNEPIVKAVHKDLGKCKPLVLKDDTVSKGSLRNAVGKFKKIEKANKNSLAAHILQGYEALALHIAIKQQNGRIQLLCHDGFVTKEEIDTNQIIEEFLSKTGGIEIAYKTEKIEPIRESVSNKAAPFRGAA